MLLGFKPRFRSPIEKETKIHTMRNTPKRDPNIGEILYMYTGLRTKFCSLIRKDKTLKSKDTIRVIFYWFEHPSGRHKPSISINGKGLTMDAQEEFYVNDGFENEEDFVSFWNLIKGQDCHFIGRLFHWTDFKY